MSKTILFCLTSVPLLLSGCAWTTSELAIDTSHLSARNQEFNHNKTAIVRSVTDARTFDPNTPDASQPSLDVNDSEEKNKAIGRKRNGYGKALGAFVLAKDQTVSGLVQQAIEQALRDNNYQVLDSKERMSKDTLVIDVEIQKFWAWVRPMFWSARISNNIETKLTLSGTASDVVTIKGAASENVHSDFDSTWKEIIDKSYKRYYQNAKAELSKY